MTIHLTLCHPKLVKGYLIKPFMPNAADDLSFNPLPPKVSQGYFINQLMARVSDDQFDLLN